MNKNKLEIQKEQFGTALVRLKEVLAAPKSAIVRDSAIQRFEFTLDLGWKTLKTFLEENKGIICASPKECFREAYRQNLLGYEEKWLNIVDMRNLTAHTYNEETAEEIYTQLPDIIKYFEELLDIFEKKK